MNHNNRNDGWIVTFAGTGINLALGILYAWSVIKGGIPDSWGWTNAEKVLPYSFACICFALAMIPAGFLQDKIGPRWVATLGGLFAGIGCIIAGISGSSLFGFVVGFGILAGIGIGFGYAATTPAAVKWFPPNKTGMIAGIVVAGFGLASVYIAPLATGLLSYFGRTKIDSVTGQEIIEKGISSTMIVFGIGFLIIVVILSQFLKNPSNPANKSASNLKNGQEHHNRTEKSWREMLSSAQFYILWMIYFVGAAAGLTFISFAQDLGKKSLGELAFLAVAVLAIGNAGGRILAGLVSDKIGRQWTLFGALLLQSIILFILYLVQGGAGWLPMLFIIILIGANYGSNLSLFPSACKDYFGLKNFGMNYGILFTAWGLAGLLMPWINGRIKDMTGSNNLTYFIIIAMLLIGAILTFVSRRIAKSLDG
jgi:MFS transporter, OFA family, oxalate/formate antiporter